MSEAALGAYKELSQARIDALKESQQKDMLTQTARIESQDKRIDRQDKLLDSFSARISDLSIIFTVAGIIIGLLGYFTVSNRAVKEARLAAGEWMKREGQDAIEARLNDFDSHIATQKEVVTKGLEKLFAGVAVSIEQQQKKMSIVSTSSDDSTQKQILSADSNAINSLAEALKHKPEAEYEFKEWNVRAHDAYNKGNKALAAEYWLLAARSSNVEGMQIAQSFCNAAIALGQINRIEEAINVYGQVVTSYGNAPEEALRELVAISLINTATMLHKLGRDTEMEAVFSQVITNYGDAPEATLRPLVAHALNGKGFTLLCHAKENWGNTDVRLANLQTAATLFIRAEKNIDTDRPFVLGNQAYATFLLEQKDAARPLLEQALLQGGENLYKATLDDLAIHPVPPDAAFRELLEKIWAEVKPKA